MSNWFNTFTTRIEHKLLRAIGIGDADSNLKARAKVALLLPIQVFVLTPLHLVEGALRSAWVNLRSAAAELPEVWGHNK